MANEQDPFSLNLRGVSQLVESDTNKLRSSTSEDSEGITGEKFDVLELDMSDAKLLRLRNDWESRYSGYEGKLKTLVKRNLESYLGKRPDGQWLNTEGPIAANLQFESEETFLSAALAKNPQPVVYADNTPEGNAIAGDVKTMLQFHADQLVLRRKMALMVRQWSINHLGVLKHGWNPEIGDVDIQNRKIQDFIFDPTGYVDAYGDFIGYLGERITITADKLIGLFPEHEDYIELVTEGKLGTDVVYTEWWSADNTFTFTTFKDKVVAKNKNPYFKYAEEAEEEYDEDGELVEMEEVEEPRNHFAAPKKPYTFLSVFSLQEQPHDITGLIEQNIANQRIIKSRTEQIDTNISASNNGYAYSEANFTQETAKQASNARRVGNPILVPEGGPIERAILALPAQNLPSAVFGQLETTKNDLRMSWGIQGITSTPFDEDQTARGMILNQSHDTSRIGGGIGDAIEQVADNTFNWLVQLYYVFYDEAHFAAVVGNAKAVEYVQFSNVDLNRSLIVSVAPDSMKPKDEISEMNMAQALFDKGAIGPKTLLKMVDFPDPEEAASDGALWTTDKMLYMQLNFPELFQQMQQAQQPQMPMGRENIPPEQITEPTGDLSMTPASADLSNVPLPRL